MSYQLTTILVILSSISKKTKLICFYCILYIHVLSDRFYAGHEVENFTMKPYKVSEAAFHDCNIEDGVPIIPDFTSESILVKSEFLQPGHNYFIGKYNLTL